MVCLAAIHAFEHGRRVPQAVLPAAAHSVLKQAQHAKQGSSVTRALHTVCLNEVVC
jgi:hypothetical protein